MNEVRQTAVHTPNCSVSDCDVESVKESNCKVLNCGLRVQHVTTKCDGKVVKDTVTPDDEMDKITYGGDGHDVEHVTAVHKIVYLHDIYLRNTRGKLRVKTGVLITAVKDSMSTMAELTDEIEELTTDVIDYGVISHTMTFAATSYGE